MLRSISIKLARLAGKTFPQTTLTVCRGKLLAHAARKNLVIVHEDNGQGFVIARVVKTQVQFSRHLAVRFPLTPNFVAVNPLQVLAKLVACRYQAGSAAPLWQHATTAAVWTAELSEFRKLATAVKGGSDTLGDRKVSWASRVPQYF